MGRYEGSQRPLTLKENRGRPPVHSNLRRAPAGELPRSVIGQPASVTRQPPSVERQPPSVKRVLPPMNSGLVKKEEPKGRPCEGYKVRLPQRQAAPGNLASSHSRPLEWTLHPRWGGGGSGKSNTKRGGGWVKGILRCREAPPRLGV